MQAWSGDWNNNIKMDLFTRCTEEDLRFVSDIPIPRAQDEWVGGQDLALKKQCLVVKKHYGLVKEDSRYKRAIDVHRAEIIENQEAATTSFDALKLSLPKGVARLIIQLASPFLGLEDSETKEFLDGLYNQ